MPRRLVLFLFLSSVALAGCSDAGPSEEEKFQESVAKGESADVPTWNVGDFWTFTMKSMGQEVGIASYVVTTIEGADYVVETDSAQVAYYDARFDISFMGKIRKSDLAGSQGSQRVAMFEWPLTAGKEWTTTWDGDTLNMAASSMGPNQFHVMGHRQGDDAMTVEYHYNAEKKWFEYIVFYDPDNGTESFRLDLQSSGADYTGEIFRYAFGETHHFMAGPQESGVHEVRLGEEWNELGVTMFGDCAGAAAGAVAVGLSSDEHAAANPGPMLPQLNEPEYGNSILCHDDTDFVDAFVIANNGGTWSYGLLAGAPEAVAALVIEERARTVLPFPFG